MTEKSSKPTASAAAPATATPAPNGATGKSITPEMLRDPAVQKQIAEMRSKLQAAVGQIVLALASLPRYRSQMLGDVQAMILDPLMRDRIAIASEKADNAEDAMQSLAGIAFWATVSPEVDARIREQIKAGSFPVRLKPDDWTSGEITWLLDVIAPSQKMASDVLLNFRKVLKSGADVRIHPVVVRQIEPELLKKLGAAPADAAPVSGTAKG
jgi:cytolysin-activating lysine-acyltransferase